MALSKSSKILVSDINTALSNKQDKLSYTPVKSVNGTTADSSGNVAISVSAPVTSVNGMTGDVTVSSINSATVAYITPNVANLAQSNAYVTLPYGGTWTWYSVYACGTNAGGTTVSLKGTSSYSSYAFCIRTA